MHVFITGGSGLTGPAVVSELLSAGHRVTGLARSAASADRLARLGAEPFAGSLDDLDRLRERAAAADGVIHMAIGGDSGDLSGITKRDVDAIEAMGAALAGTGKPFVSTSGTMVMTPGRVSEETDAPDPDAFAAYRIPGERACLGYAEWGVRSSVIRLAPTVHGPGDYGFVAMLVATARKTVSRRISGTGPTGGPRSTVSMRQPCFGLRWRRRRPELRCTERRKAVCRCGTSPKRSVESLICRSCRSNWTTRQRISGARR